MESVIPAKDKKLLEVKLGELPTWILMRDFSPSGIAGAFEEVTTSTITSTSWEAEVGGSQGQEIETILANTVKPHLY